MSDYLTRTAGLGYLKSSLLLFAIVIAILALWYLTLGSVSVNRITDRKAEAFYWAAILFSNTLGTALGDCLADTSGLGYEGGALVFPVLWPSSPRPICGPVFPTPRYFGWHSSLTRPLGATVGDLLTKPHANGGFNLSRITSSLIIAVFILVAIVLTSQKARRHPGWNEEIS